MDGRNLRHSCRKNWLAETSQTLESRRLGSQSAERERIAEIKLELS
ncbi:hypothetical protein RCO48_17560 [Peribacillus frigoritolerans]|nr:hypothetical protein [Peribacillus frigoritolerans]